MTLRSMRRIVGRCAVVLLLLLTGEAGVAEEVDCSKPILPCTACHSAAATREYARCLAQRWIAPESAKELKNPVPVSPKMIEQGKATYDIYCDGCHGPEGDGKGRVAVKFDVPVVNISAPIIQAQTDGELFWKISNGRGAMPAWGTLLPEDLRWKLTMFVRTLKKPDAR